MADIRKQIKNSADVQETVSELDITRSSGSRVRSQHMPTPDSSRIVFKVEQIKPDSNNTYLYVSPSSGPGIKKLSEGCIFNGVPLRTRPKDIAMFMQGPVGQFIFSVHAGQTSRFETGQRYKFCP